MTAPETTLQGKDKAAARSPYMSLELSDRHWKLSFGDGGRSSSRCTVAAGDVAAILERVRKAKLRFVRAADAPVHACYEAGRDG
jgi:transposase